MDLALSFVNEFAFHTASVSRTPVIVAAGHTKETARPGEPRLPKPSKTASNSASHRHIREAAAVRIYR